MITQLQFFTYIKKSGVGVCIFVADTLSGMLTAIVFVLLFMSVLTLNNRSNPPRERGTIGWFIGCAHLQMQLDVSKPRDHPKILARTTIDCSVRKEST